MDEPQIPSLGDETLPPPPLWIWPTMMLICIFSILLPAGKFRLLCGVPLVKLFSSSLWRSKSNVQTYTHSIQCFLLLCRWVDFTVIHDPERDFWAVDPAAEKKRKTPDPHAIKAPSGSWAMLKWWTSLLLNIRGIGLNIQYKFLPAPVPKHYPKSSWILSLLVTITWTYFLTDLVTHLLARYSTNTPFFSQPLSLQILCSFLHAIRFVTGVEWTYDILAIFCVAIGLGTPQDWPPTFGSWSENCYTLTGLWGRFYHQWLRRNVMVAGMLVNKLLGLEKGTKTSRYSQVVVAFAFSALIHTVGAIAGSFADDGFWQAMFFLAQPVGIVVEEHVMKIGRQLGIKKSGWAKGIGFVWVAAWMLYTLRWMIAYVPVEWIRDDRPPSVVEYILELVANNQ